MSVFVNRKEELKILEERFKGSKAEFLLLYGRRRIGKSELIEQFLRQKRTNGIRLLARNESKKLQLENFKNKLADFFQDEFLKKAEFRDWDGFFEYLTKKSNKRIVIALDEFPFLAKEDSSLPSIIQDYWDSKLKNTKIFLILSGSSIRMMESFMGYKSPLYGRRTGQILLKPFRFMDIFQFVKDIEKSILFYSVFGGTPAYFIEINLNKSLEENIKQNILKIDSFINKDVEFVLRQELEEPRYYFSILLSISRGNHTQGLICNDTGLGKSIVNKYLSVLMDLQLVRRIVSVTESYKSKKSLYLLDDNLFDFWFRFVYPNADKLERGEIESVLNNIKSSLNEYTGKHFEEIVLEIFPKLLNSNFTKIGKWWYKYKEIDIIALNEQKEIVFAECKWQEKINALKLLRELVEKAKYVNWNKDKRKEDYIIFAKSFKKKIKSFEGKKVHCFDLKDIEGLLNKKPKAVH